MNVSILLIICLLIIIVPPIIVIQKEKKNNIEGNTELEDNKETNIESQKLSPQEQAKKLIAEREAARDYDLIAKVEEYLMNINDENLNALENMIQNTEEGKIKQSLVLGLSRAIENFAEDNIIDDNEEKIINDFMDKYSITRDDFTWRRSTYEKLVKLMVIKDLLNGITPQRVKISQDSTIGINFQKDESIIWCFEYVNYSVLTERKVYQANTQSFSIKIAKGLYYKPGAISGETISTSSVVYKATGWLFFTNKNIYFYQKTNSLRIPYSKILTYTASGEEAIYIQMDGANSKPVFFSNIDSWFIFNILQNIQNIA